MSHFNVSSIAWAKSQDSVHKPHLLKRKESRSGSNRGSSLFQPSALPLGHTGSHNQRCTPPFQHTLRHGCVQGLRQNHWPELTLRLSCSGHVSSCCCFAVDWAFKGLPLSLVPPKEREREREIERGGERDRNREREKIQLISIIVVSGYACVLPEKET